MKKNKFKTLALTSLSLVPIIALNLSTSCSNNKNNSSNGQIATEQTKKPNSILKDNIVTKLDNGSSLVSTIDIHNLNLNLKLNQSYHQKNIRIYFGQKAVELFDLTNTNFTEKSNYKFLEDSNYKYSNEEKYIELKANDLSYAIKVEIFEENKTPQQVLININFEFINNDSEIEFLKLQEGGIILNDVKVNAYAKLISDLNLIYKDMDFSTLTNQNIKEKLLTYKDDKNNNIYKDINLTINESSNSYNNELIFNIAGKFKTFIITPIKIEIKNIFSYNLPKNKIYKLNSNLELKDKFIIDLKNESDIKLLTPNQIINYIKPFVIVDVKSNDEILNIDPSKFKSIKIEFENNLNIKKISGSFEITLYKNNSWQKEELQITFVDKSTIHFAFDYSLKYFSDQEILDTLVNNFVVVNNDVIKNTFASKLHSDFSNNINRLPLSFDKEKIDLIASKYFNNNKTFIFEYISENSLVDDINGILEFSYSVANENNEYVKSNKTNTLTNLLKFNDFYKDKMEKIENNSSQIKEKYTKNIINDISKNKNILSQINSLKDGKSLILENFDNTYLDFIKRNSNLTPNNINSLVDNVSLKILSVNINNYSWNIDTSIFDNAFKLENIIIDLSDNKQTITKDYNGFSYSLKFKYILNISNNEIVFNGEFYTKILSFSK
ncbi:hypothetical protein [Malacoplasma iowae]|uniref:Uncharacterized protein n=2 Tax=Malacoplasma iowae TaxID=2116 RepID=A0A6P1LHD3_MALIO|nr:hypothetical protein [Malacoplasma iowae]VEU63070.1 Uncharacterised protein [Mycoplasmopsis fermentans]EGZ30910.1 hypothetical protein GUU_04519 [Malacoplasma iowae 695]QHG89515.1 hypothetical protein EER00_01200 [Malacoplasma iowae 695]WPL35791.1 hypothetical protein QX180_05730 [Malacoplasma iowae]VEU71813.1 Uncharacterised protein [Malacoplasma iowae]